MTQTIALPIASEAETQQLASVLAQHLRAGDVVLLDGALAAGKTFFSKALIASLGSEENVTSPTYAVANIYDDTDVPILHVDAYRLASAREFHMLGLEDYLENGISIIEWGTRVAEAFEAPLRINIGFGDHETERRVSLSSDQPRWASVLEALA